MIPLNYHHLYYFWVVAKTGSITRASRRLYLAQPTLSLQIRQLEKSMGHRLFHRTRDGITLTPEGRIALEHCEKIFTQGEALAKLLSPQGRPKATFLRLGVSRSLTREAVLAVLEEVERRCPGVSTTVFTGSAAELRDRMAKFALDAAVCDADVSAGLGASYQSRLAGSIPIQLVGAPRLIARLRRDGFEAPMLLRGADHPLRKQVEDALNGRKIKFSTVAETDDVELIRILALRGRGIAALSQWATAADAAAGKLGVAKIGKAALKEHVWIVVTALPQADPRLQKALEALKRLSISPRLRS